MPPPNGVELPIFHKIVELYELFCQYIKLFPKREKFGIGQKCDNVLLEILELIIIASQIPKNQKLSYLEKASVKLNVLKILFRIIKKLKIIDIKKYIELESHCQEVGKMLGGWIKSLKIGC